MASKPVLSGTDLLHADDLLHGTEVSPSISVTTTFRKDPDFEENESYPSHPLKHVYSRYSQDVSIRVEKVLGKVTGGFAITYASGLAAGFAALVHLQPKRLAITHGYIGFHETIRVYKKISSDLEIIDLDDDFKPGDVCWLETPLNPTGEARDIQYYADKIHAVGGKLAIDSTFAPPPLQDPFKWGADLIMHSATKYMGGHSDLLGGVLIAKSVEERQELWHDRTYLGNMMGSLECWLLLRSLRTLHIRVARQSETATALVKWLSNAADGQEYDGIPAGALAGVLHSSLQKEDSRGFRTEKQMEGGHSPTFSILMTKPEYAKSLPYATEIFIPATSLGGVESLMEYRHALDPAIDPRLVRVSVGVEDLEDLKNDLKSAFRKLLQQGNK